MILFVMTYLKSWSLPHTYAANGSEFAYASCMHTRKNAQGRMGTKIG